MQRYFFQIVYKGTSYYGWQRQKKEITIQGKIEEALAKICQPSKVVGSGRTDAGVHAWSQVAHVDLLGNIEVEALRKKLNAVLPFDIYIKTIFEVSSNMHARYSALSRSYEYHINLHKDPFTVDTTYHFPFLLDLDMMNQGAALLLGKKSFASFCKKHALPHYYCEVTEAIWERKEKGYTFFITANRFLYGMVRAIAGTLLDMGRGKISQEDLKDIIKAQNRSKASRSLPARGLFLTWIHYPSISNGELLSWSDSHEKR